MKRSAKIIQESSKEVNYHLDDKFCDATDLNFSMESNGIPPLVQFFFLKLLNFNKKYTIFEGDLADVRSDEKLLKMQTLYQTRY